MLAAVGHDTIEAQKNCRALQYNADADWDETGRNLQCRGAKLSDVGLQIGIKQGTVGASAQEPDREKAYFVPKWR